MHKYLFIIPALLLFSCGNSEFQNKKNLTINSTDSLKQLADSLYNLGIVYEEDTMDYNKALGFYEKTVELYETIGNKDKLSLAYKHIGFAYYYLEDHVKSAKYHKQALKTADEMGNKRQAGINLNNLGIAYTILGDIDSALIFYNKALVLHKSVGDTLGIIEEYQNMGITYSYNGDLKNATECHIKALHYCEQSSYTKGIFEMYLNLALDYHGCEEFDLALNHIVKAEVLLDSITNLQSKAGFFHTYAVLLFQKGKFTKAKEYYFKTLNISLENDYRRGEAAAYDGLADIAMEEEDYDMALKYNGLSMDLEKAIHNYSGVIQSLDLFAEIEYKQGNHIKAIEYLKKSEKLAKEEGFVIYFSEIYYTYYKIYKAENKLKSALSYYEMYTAINDSIAGVEVKERMADLEIKHKTEKNKQQIILLNKENETKKQKLKARNFLIISLVLVVLVIISIVYLFHARGVQKLNKMESELQKYLLKIRDSEKDDCKEDQESSKFKARTTQIIANGNLTEREIEVLHFISEGMSNVDIAEKIFVSTNTIKYHIKNIYLKLDVNNRVEALNKIKQHA